MSAVPQLFLLRASVFLNGSSAHGKVVPVASDFETFLASIRTAFDEPGISTLFTVKGAVLSDVQLIRDDETLYAAKDGEPFIPTPSRSYSPSSTSTQWISLNVGGTLFSVSRTTLINAEEGSLLSKMFDPHSKMEPSSMDPHSGAYLLDREPKYFAPLLNYLRTGKLILDPEQNPHGVLEEAKYFQLQSMIPKLEEIISSSCTPGSQESNPPSLTREDVIRALLTTSNEASLRFQGVNLTHADLSYLDLRNINFKYAKLRYAKLSYCNLSFCNFERADMTGVEMNCATLSGVRMACALMEGAHCINCNFQDPSGKNANMEGVNLRNAVMEDSDLTGANLRVANLKGANLKATILRGAILAGADLGNSDLTGSDLHEANLRGANLRDASLELMINPLHMAQAIR